MGDFDTILAKIDKQIDFLWKLKLEIVKIVSKIFSRMTNCVSYFDMFQCLSTYDTVYKVGQGYPFHAGKVLKIFKTGNTVEMYMIYMLVNF